ncbi:hypothetical protein RBU61_00780 [Tissierella sp. MB52-C2]|uniref:hypothetical protein n=1 Tax=Tissierella sp. MB52-C2 TaxID=3070999 RepID=UPI00280B1BAF|nr:hypothetical protein [Tissierella sp. MB52-C2]WMM25225.1 hypothetical protein RBU61_00780 [Tissierella sp. MB52-C2]
MNLGFKVELVQTDNELFYNIRQFSSYKKKFFIGYSERYKNIAREILSLQKPNAIAKEYYSENAI